MPSLDRDGNGKLSIDEIIAALAGRTPAERSVGGFRSSTGTATRNWTRQKSPKSCGPSVSCNQSSIVICAPTEACYSPAGTQYFSHSSALQSRWQAA